MNKNSRIFIAGHKGFVGNALYDRLVKEGYSNLFVANRQEVDFMDENQVATFFDKYEPEYVFGCVAKVGGIRANMEDPYGFLFQNLAIQNNLIQNCIRKNSKLVFLGSSCIYPKDYAQPLKEDHLLAAPVEPTNEGYSLAKICGLKLCEYANKQFGTEFISLMPCNLYGPGDDYDPNNSHVLSAMVKKVVDAKRFGKSEVEIWGSGNQRREFLFISDLVDSMLWAIENVNSTSTFLNVGTGKDITILELAKEIADIIGYEGEFVCNTEKPDGMMLKCLDVTKINELGWEAKTELRDGLKYAIRDYTYRIETDQLYRSMWE